MTTHIVIAAIICAATCTPTRVQVWDGDSLRIGREAIRIMNIDAPEIGDKSRCAAEAELAEKAKVRLVSMLSAGNVVIRRAGYDKYRRTLAVITVDGGDVGDAMVASGLARTWSGRREPWCQ